MADFYHEIPECRSLCGGWKKSRLSFFNSFLLVLPFLASCSDSENSASSEIVEQSTLSQVDDADAAGAEPEDIMSEPLCQSTPKNGQIFSGSGNLVNKGHVLEIDNGTSGDAIIKIRSADLGKTYASFFVRRGETASIEGLKSDSFRIQYAIGDMLGEDCKSFVGQFSASQFPEIDELKAEYINDLRGEGYLYSKLSYTLYSVPSGNIQPSSISTDDFDAN